MRRNNRLVPLGLALPACGGEQRPLAATPVPEPSAAPMNSAPPPAVAGAPEPAPTAPAIAAAAPSPPPSDTPAPQAPPVAGYELGSPQKNADIQALVEATADIVTLPAFRDHLLALTTLRATPDAPPTLHGEEVYRAYAGFDAATKPGPIRYAPKLNFLHQVEGCHSQTASTTFGGASGSTVFLNQCTFDRAASKPPPGSDAVEAFACAINTIAHEWTHAIADDHLAERYLDKGHNAASGMLVSYTVGALAQCTYLERGDHLPGSFANCLDAAGTNILKTAPCTPGWAKHHTH